jgi:hypothetical protein
MIEREARRGRRRPAHLRRRGFHSSESWSESRWGRPECTNFTCNADTVGLWGKDRHTRSCSLQIRIASEASRPRKWNECVSRILSWHSSDRGECASASEIPDARPLAVTRPHQSSPRGQLQGSRSPASSENRASFVSIRKPLCGNLNISYLIRGCCTLSMHHPPLLTRHFCSRQPTRVKARCRCRRIGLCIGITIPNTVNETFLCQVQSQGFIFYATGR